MSVHFKSSSKGPINMRSESARKLAARKSALEADLLKLISAWEDENGLSVTEITLVRPEVAGFAEPRLENVRTTVELITG